MRSCVYEGVVHHRRRGPKPHRFSYSLCMLDLDLAELPTLFDPHVFWSARRPALAWFRRKDHSGDPETSLDDAVRDLVEERLGRRPLGRIGLLTQPRYFGYIMNPISIFHCHDPETDALDAIVAEVTNTPWRERHCYVLDARPQSPAGGLYRFDFDKDFHVSPFMPMNQRYEMRLTAPNERLRVHMRTFEDHEAVFDASLNMSRRPWSSASLARTLTRFPFMTAQVVAAIYFEAFRLWLKRTPFHPHPRHLRRQEASS